LDGLRYARMSKEPRSQQENAAGCPPVIVRTATGIEAPVRCTFCGVDDEYERKVVIGFGTVICDGCVALCRAEENGLPVTACVVPFRPEIVGPRGLAKGILPASRPFASVCPFCDREPSTARRLFVGDTGSICSECIATCEQIYGQERGPPE
jgi:hypothetical protein